MKKIGICVVIGLLLGFVCGYVVGNSGRGELENQVESAKARENSTKEALERETKKHSEQIAENGRSKGLILARVDLFQALLELNANNFGLASQHLGAARTRLQSTTKGMDSSKEKRVMDLLNKISDSQTLTMRLDIMARAQVEKILADLQQIPGAR
ncbi:MAG: hypothetical protein V1754_04350 [Pseudomonadota bacterium]